MSSTKNETDGQVPPPGAPTGADVVVDDEDSDFTQEQIDEIRPSFNRKRCMQLACGVPGVVPVAAIFAFGLVSSPIKTANGFSQQDMTTISTVGNIIAMFGLPGGMTFDVLGPRVDLVTSSVLTGTGFVLLALIFKRIITPSIATLCVANAISNFGCGFADTGNVMGTLFSFPLNKGHVIIMQKTFEGLGTTFLSLVYNCFFSESQNYFGYCLFVAIFTYAVTLIAAVFTQLPPYQRTGWYSYRIKKASEEEQAAAARKAKSAFLLYHNPRLTDHARLNYALICLWVTFLFYATISVIEAFVKVSPRVRIALGVLSVLCLAIPFVGGLPCKFPSFLELNFLPSLSASEEREVAIAQDIIALNQGKAVDETLGDTGPAEDNVNEEAVLAREQSNQGGNRTDAGSPRRLKTRLELVTEENAAEHASHMFQETFLQSLLSPLFWCLFWGAFCVWGMGFVFSNNSSQIYDALLNGETYSSSINTFDVALFGIGSAIGRISAGYGEMILSERSKAQLVRQSKLKELISEGAAKESDVASHLTPVHHQWFSSVTIMLPLPPIVMTIACLFVLVLPSNAVPVMFVLAGLAMGQSYGLSILSAKEIYAVQAALHYNFCYTGAMVGTGVVNSGLFGKLYDKEAEKQSGGASSCSGLACIRTTMIVGLAINASCILTSMYAVYAWRKRRMEKIDSEANERANKGATADSNGISQPQALADEELAKREPHDGGGKDIDEDGNKDNNDTVTSVR